MSNMLYKDFAPGLRLVVNGTHDPDDAEWDAMVDVTRKLTGLTQFRILVLSGGGSPTLRQRKSVDAVMAGFKVPARTAIVSSSAAMRAVLSAVGWVSRLQLRAFSPGQLAEACRFLELTDAEMSEMQPAIQRMTQQMGLVAFSQAS